MNSVGNVSVEQHKMINKPEPELDLWECSLDGILVHSSSLLLPTGQSVNTQQTYYSLDFITSIMASLASSVQSYIHNKVLGIQLNSQFIVVSGSTSPSDNNTDAYVRYQTSEALYSHCHPKWFTVGAMQGLTVVAYKSQTQNACLQNQ